MKSGVQNVSWVVRRVDMRWCYYFGVIALVAAMVGCSKKAAPQPVESQPSAIHISRGPPGSEPDVFVVILTNSQPPPMRSVIAISKTMRFEWHKVADDGTESTVKGVVPTKIVEAVMAEWRTMSGRTSVDPTREQAVYVGSVDGVHPPQVKRLLDYVSK